MVFIYLIINSNKWWSARFKVILKGLVHLLFLIYISVSNKLDS